METKVFDISVFAEQHSCENLSRRLRRSNHRQRWGQSYLRWLRREVRLVFAIFHCWKMVERKEKAPRRGRALKMG